MIDMFFNFKKSKEENNYPEVVQEIHESFEMASIKEAEEAEKALKSLDLSGLDKSKRLRSVGFGAAKGVEDSFKAQEEERMSKARIEEIMYFKNNYPLFKFITGDKVVDICKKYGLVCGDSALFKGFVPEKNLSDIEKFKEWLDKGSLKPEDDYGYEEIRLGNFHTTVERISRKTHDDKTNMKNDAYHYNMMVASPFSTTYRAANMLIAAPLKDMEMGEGMLVNDKMQIVSKPVMIDPVVLYPVRDDAYLIVTAWGDEASDPDVVNEIMN